MVKPFALNDKTISSIPVNRRCRFVTICGSNLDSVSQSTVGRRPGAGIPAVAARGLILLIPRVLVHLGLQRRVEQRRGQLGEQPVGAHRLTPSAVAGSTR